MLRPIIPTPQKARADHLRLIEFKWRNLYKNLREHELFYLDYKMPKIPNFH